MSGTSLADFQLRSATCVFFLVNISWGSFPMHVSPFLIKREEGSDRSSTIFSAVTSPGRSNYQSCSDDSFIWIKEFFYLLNSYYVYNIVLSMLVRVTKKGCNRYEQKEYRGEGKEGKKQDCQGSNPHSITF